MTKKKSYTFEDVKWACSFSKKKAVKDYKKQLHKEITKMHDSFVRIRNQQFGSPRDYEIMSHRIGVIDDVLELLSQEKKK